LDSIGVCRHNSVTVREVYNVETGNQERRVELKDGATTGFLICDFTAALLRLFPDKDSVVLNAQGNVVAESELGTTIPSNLAKRKAIELDDD
jgi:hypothetical protein